jgi:hypothetical protein
MSSHRASPLSDSRCQTVTTHAMVLVVLLGGVVWMGTATAPAAQATKWIRLGVPFTVQLPSTVMIIVCAGACRTA